MVVTRSQRKESAKASYGGEAAKPRRKRAVPSSSSSEPLAKKQLFAPNPTTPAKTAESDANCRKITTPPDNKKILFSLQATETLYSATLLARPSKRNRSPYVADIQVRDDDDDVTTRTTTRPAIAHVPNLDMGGKCIPGSTLLVKAARDKKGVKIGRYAVSPKYGTPKCEFHAQLLRVDESQWCSDYTPTWVAAQPSLGERIAEVWLRDHNLLGEYEQFQRQVTIGNMRSDFQLTYADGTKRLVEVKQVVDTDYAASAPPPASMKCRFLSSTQPYRRTGIFPWGTKKQKGPNGESVVSARAIRHVRELTRHVQSGNFRATVLFVVVRGDAEAFRPNGAACPSFARYLRQAHEAGVQIMAKRVSWGEQESEWGVCFDDGVELPIDWNGIVNGSRAIEG